VDRSYTACTCGFNFVSLSGKLKTALWYYAQASFAVGLAWLSDQITHPGRFPLVLVISAEGAFAAIITVPLVAIILVTEDRYKMRERLRSYAKVLVLIVAWLIGLINQVFGGIITALAPLATISAPFFQGLVVVLIIGILGIVAECIRIVDITRIIVTVGRGSHTVLDYKPEAERGSLLARALRRLCQRLAGSQKSAELV